MSSSESSKDKSGTTVDTTEDGKSSSHKESQESSDTSKKKTLDESGKSSPDKESKESPENTKKKSDQSDSSSSEKSDESPPKVEPQSAPKEKVAPQAQGNSIKEARERLQAKQEKSGLPSWVDQEYLGALRRLALGIFIFSFFFTPIFLFGFPVVAYKFHRVAAKSHSKKRYNYFRVLSWAAYGACILILLAALVIFASLGNCNNECASSNCVSGRRRASTSCCYPNLNKCYTYAAPYTPFDYCYVDCVGAPFVLFTAIIGGLLLLMIGLGVAGLIIGLKLLKELREKVPAKADEGMLLLNLPDGVDLPVDVKRRFDLNRVEAEKWACLEGGVYTKDVSSASSEWFEAENFLKKFMDMPRRFGQEMSAVRVTFVNNPKLVAEFAAQREKVSEGRRAQPEVFNSTDWKDLDDKSKCRSWELQHLTTLTKRFPWNVNAQIDSESQPQASTEFEPILAMVHGTSVAVAEAMIQKGFSKHAMLEDGFFGSGMYFTSSARYALPYYASRKKPCLVVCYVLPGNAFPATEDPKQKRSLAGSPIRKGYQSHYVLATRDGKPCKKRVESDYYNELVVDQESQVLPFMIVELKPEDLASEAKEFARTVLTNKTADAIADK